MLLIFQGLFSVPLEIVLNVWSANLEHLEVRIFLLLREVVKVMVSTEYRRSLKGDKTMLLHLLPKSHNSVRMFPL